MVTLFASENFWDFRVVRVLVCRRAGVCYVCIFVAVFISAKVSFAFFGCPPSLLSVRCVFWDLAAHAPTNLLHTEK